MTTDYRPVSCDLHSELELLALRGARVTIDADCDGREVVGRVASVSDVLTRDGAEFLVLVDTAGTFCCRLDRIRRIRLEDGRQIFDQGPDRKPSY